MRDRHGIPARQSAAAARWLVRWELRRTCRQRGLVLAPAQIRSPSGLRLWSQFVVAGDGLP
ncbi:MAG: hypothetical protein U0872_03295 [Planctomycetaceae bacterium]